MEKRKISLKGVDQLQLLGPGDEYLHMLESSINAKIVVRGDDVVVIGEEGDVETAEKLFAELVFLVHRNGRLSTKDVQTVIDLVNNGSGEVSTNLKKDSKIIFYSKKGLIQPKSKGQEAYAVSVCENDIVFAVGPAGTGKTFLAVAMALARLREKAVSKIVLARPAIEAGESLGFLPGDLMEKVDPYLRPLTDALFDMLPSDQLQKYVERKIIEIVPLAYMRGRTLNDAFVILDEAQNTSPIQMKMFLTRLGVNSKAIITGDDTQIDLPDKIPSGLIQIQDILKGIEGIGFVYLDADDVVRHRLVREIIRAYDFYENHNSEEYDAP